MEPDTSIVNAARAAFEDLLDEGPLAPDWERASGQIVPMADGDPRPRYAFRGVHPLAAAMAVVVVLVGAAAIFLSDRWEASDPDDTSAVGREVASEQREAVTPGNQENICDLFTEEEVTGMVRGAYVDVGITDGESSMLLVEDTLAEGTRGYGDSCDWLAAATSWVILERIQDDRHDAIWSTGGFYQTRDDRTFEPDESMPAGVEVANVLVRPGYNGQLWVSIDVQVVEDAPQWWRFNMVTEWTDLAHYTSFVTPEHRLIARDLAFNVASQMFESLRQDS